MLCNTNDKATIECKGQRATILDYPRWLMDSVQVTAGDAEELGDKGSFLGLYRCTPGEQVAGDAPTVDWCSRHTLTVREHVIKPTQWSLVILVYKVQW